MRMPESLIGFLERVKTVRICLFCDKKVERYLAKKGYAMCRRCIPLFECHRPRVVRRNVRD